MLIKLAKSYINSSSLFLCLITYLFSYSVAFMLRESQTKFHCIIYNDNKDNSFIDIIHYVHYTQWLSLHFHWSAAISASSGLMLWSFYFGWTCVRNFLI